MNQSKKDSLVIGFALFSMFFGAGNVIFPPYLGLTSASSWILGFICYYAADIGLALFALFAILRSGSSSAITAGLGKIPATIMMCLIVLCIGPMVAIPRTAATTYEMSVKPLSGSISPILFSILFFTLILLLAIRESAVIDIVGKILTPVLLIGLLIVIVKGIVSPIAPIAASPLISNVANQGIKSGYQTLDVLAVMVFGVLILNTAEKKGYHNKYEKQKVVAAAGIIACIALFFTYMGLTYLGATVSTLYNGHMNRSALVIAIVKSLMGQTGLVLFSIVIALACITTALALVSSCAAYFTTLSRGKLPYKTLVILICVLSAVFSNVGLEQIVAIASPILDLIYPPVLTTIILSYFSHWKYYRSILIWSVLGALISSICMLVFKSGHVLSFMMKLPFYSLGFGWLLPAFLLGVAGFAIPLALSFFNHSDH